MDLRFNEAQEMLKKMAKDFLATECPKTKVRELKESQSGHSPELWNKMSELGWMGLTIPEEYDGLGQSFLDLAVLTEEIGKSILPAPLIPTVLSAYAIMDGGNPEQKKEFLSNIAAGKMIVSPAYLETEAIYGPAGINLKASAKGDNYLVSGIKLFVENANVADYLLCVLRTGSGTKPEDGISVFMVNAKSPGVKIEVIPTIALSHLCEVAFENVSIPKKNLIGSLDKGWAIWQKLMERGAILKSAESLGGMQTVVDMTVAYSKERVQYGLPIGAFQALQHYMADMVISLLTSRYLVYETAWMESEGMPCAKQASMAKSYSNESYKFISRWGIQLHGGIGTSYEHDVSLYYKEAKTNDSAYGTTDYHRELVAQAIGMI